jgi:hypothetical protein
MVVTAPNSARNAAEEPFGHFTPELADTYQSNPSEKEAA